MLPIRNGFVRELDFVRAAAETKLNTRIRPLEKRAYKIALNNPRLRRMVPKSLGSAGMRLLGKLSAPLKVEFSTEEKAAIARVYQKGNRCLANETGLPLAQYGYPL